MSSETKNADNSASTGWLGKLKGYVFHIYTIAFILGAVIFIVMPMLLPKWLTTLSPSFTEADMTGRWISVFMSMFLTVIVTQELLKRQTHTQLDKQLLQKKNELEESFKKRKEEKVYEEKLKVYRDIILKICEVVKDGQVTSEESIELQSLSILTFMHSPKHAEAIIASIAAIRSKTDGDDFIIIQELNKIAALFHDELYGDHSDSEIVFNKDVLTAAYDKTREKQNELPKDKDKDAAIAEMNRQPDDEEENDESTGTPKEMCDNSVTATKWEDWLLGENIEGWNLVLYPKKDNKHRRLGIYRWYSGDLVIEAQFPDDGREFSRALGWHEKTTLRSRRGNWRALLKEEFRKYTDSDIIEEYHKEGSRFRQYVDAQFDKFLRYLEIHNTRYIWKQALKREIDNKKLGWSTGIWDFHTLYTDIPHSSPLFGSVYIDTHLVDNETRMIVYVSEREHRGPQMDNLKRILPKMQPWQDPSSGLIYLRSYFDVPANKEELATLIADKLTAIQEKIKNEDAKNALNSQGELADNESMS